MSRLSSRIGTFGIAQRCTSRRESSREVYLAGTIGIYRLLCGAEESEGGVAYVPLVRRSLGDLARVRGVSQVRIFPRFLSALGQSKGIPDIGLTGE